MRATIGARAALLSLALLGACASPPVPEAVLPSDAVNGIGDPSRAAILSSAYAFSASGHVAERPDAAARAVAQVEYLAVEITYGPRWTAFNPSISRELLAARDELREALGISPQAPPQAVVDGLYRASRALAAGDGSAAAGSLAAPDFASGRATLASLNSLPALPRTRSATALTQQELMRVDQDGRFSGAGDGGGKN